MQIHTMEQGTDEWFAARCGVPTASEFSKLITGTGKASDQMADYAALLAAELYAGSQLERWEGNAWTERGHELEDAARADYEFLRDVEVEIVGFVTNHGAGASPDGFVGDEGLHEIKCLSPQKHVGVLAYHKKNGTVPAQYIPQLQGQIWVCERAWADITFYHPNLPGLTVRVDRDGGYITSLEKRVVLCLQRRDELVSTIREAA